MIEEDYKNDKEQNLGVIERLSEQLEQLYKELEFYQKENTLLENYILRVLETKVEDIPEDDTDQKELTLDQKYEIALNEE